MALKRSLAWVAASQGASFVLQFGASVVLARMLTPHDMGIFAVAAAMVGVLGLIQAFGLGSFIVREETLTPDLIVTAFSVNVATSILLSGAIAGLSFLGGAFLNDAGVREVLLVLALTPLLSLLEFLPAAQLERRGRFKTLALVGTARMTVVAVLTIALALTGYSYMSLAYAQVAGGAIGAVAMMVVGREYVQFRFGLKGWRRIAGFGSQMIAVAGVTEVARRGSDILIARMLGLADLGVFNRASNLNNLVWDKIHAIIGRVMFVDFAQHKRQGLSLRTRYLATVEIVTALLWPAFIGLAILAGPFILAVYGAKWTPAAAPLALLAVASAVLVSITMTWEVFVASGELRTQTRIEFIRAGLGFAAVAAGCTISLTAAAAARVLEAVIAVLIYRPHLERMTETRLADFLPIYGRSGVLTAVAVAPAAAVMIAHGGSPNAPLGLALGSVVLGLALWAIALVLLRHPIMVEIAQVARRLRPTARDKRP